MVDRRTLWTSHPRSEQGCERFGALTAPWRCSRTPRTSAFGLRVGTRRLLRGLRLQRPDRRRRRDLPLRGLAVREERAAWLVMGVGARRVGGGGDHLDARCSPNDPNPPYPSRRRRLYLAFYPGQLRARSCCWRARARDSFRSEPVARRRDRRLTVAALSPTLAFQPIVDAHRRRPTAAVAVNLAYPVGDLLLLACGDASSA